MKLDHPRIRGEHDERAGCTALRGWIIPAYAGNTLSADLGIQSVEDHPRIRGEHLQLDTTLFSRVRIIPAYAGNT